MKIRFLIVIVMVSMISIPVMGQTSVVDVGWSGAGNLNIAANVGNDFLSTFNTSGNLFGGSYKVTDMENNPYGYGVKDFSAQVNATVSNGGMMEFVNTRTDSYSPMYGPAGQESYSYINTDDSGAMAFRTGGNFASLQSSNYGFQSNNQFQASGNNFLIQHSLTESTGEQAYITNTGSGSGNITLMSESTWGTGGSLQFGQGCGCYTNAKVAATGSGMLNVSAVAENQINVDMLPFTVYGDGTLGSAQYRLGVVYGAGLNIDNFSLNLN